MQNWNLYREYRPDELFIQNHAAYIATRPNAELAPLGDNALGIVAALQAGPLTTTQAAAACGYSYHAAARVFRRLVEHGLVSVEVGERNRKSYTLIPEWRERLEDNRRRSTTYGLAVERRYKTLGRTIGYLVNRDKPADAARLEEARNARRREAATWRWIKLDAGIVPFTPPPGGALEARLRRLAQARLVGDRALHRRNRPRAEETPAGKWRRAEYAQAKAQVEANWKPFSSWAAARYGADYLVNRDEIDVIGLYKVYEVATAQGVNHGQLA